MLREKSCGAVVYRKQEDSTRYLLLNYAAGHWDFVKGNVEPNETEIQTATRELQEETGIVDPKFLDGFREAIVYFYRRQGLTVHKEVVFYIIETHTEKVELSFEHIGFVWLGYQQAMQKLTFKNARDTLQKAHDFLKSKGIIKD